MKLPVASQQKLLSECIYLFPEEKSRVFVLICIKIYVIRAICKYINIIYFLDFVYYTELLKKIETGVFFVFW